MIVWNEENKFYFNYFFDFVLQRKTLQLNIVWQLKSFNHNYQHAHIYTAEISVTRFAWKCNKYTFLVLLQLHHVKHTNTRTYKLSITFQRTKFIICEKKSVWIVKFYIVDYFLFSSLKLWIGRMNCNGTKQNWLLLLQLRWQKQTFLAKLSRETRTHTMPHLQRCCIQPISA